MRIYQAPEIPPGQPTQPQLPSREQVSDRQFDTVLAVIGAMTPFLLLSHREVEGGLPMNLDGGASASAVSTFATACNRLEQMLNDKKRWSVTDFAETQTAIRAHFKGAADLNAAQVKAVEDMRCPASVHKPRLTTIGEEFIAVWGDPSLPGGMILGRGFTPEAALEDFNVAFKRRVGQQLRFAPEALERLRGQQQAQAEEEIPPAPAPAPAATTLPEPMPEEPEARHKKRKTRKKY